MNSVTPPANLQYPASLAPHRGYRRVFANSKLTLGLIAPLETHAIRPAPTMEDHTEMAQLADRLGFAALWLRDVPFYDPRYGDVAQVFDPIPYLGYLAAATRNIALGTTGIVLPFREPLIFSKQIASIDHLSSGRMLLGISSGDRPAEYPLFGIDFDTRGDRFREIYSVFRKLTEESFPEFDSPRFGQSNGEFELIPKPVTGRAPTLAVGQAQQSLPWIAEHMDGLIRSAPEPADLINIAGQWKGALVEAGATAFKPLGVGAFVDLVEDSDVPLRRTRGGFRTGAKALVEYLQAAQEAGVNHFALNLKVSNRPYKSILEELATEVLPFFKSHTNW
ncbi:LLM class oxidoreductase [Pseudomonas sp. v388]|uniref:LLM class oxidoreductase n=1 Tax=Pseudomonas sp. v388 TaxID=2479849 RepID=UPI000F7B5A29|nr:LLM class oxidoreductase [Pseudomonas sp. v388]RRV10487.1 LLM class oxidoreductase [Pseudomonas sp. v388]